METPNQNNIDEFPEMGVAPDVLHEIVNAVELQSEWRNVRPIWDEEAGPSHRICYQDKMDRHIDDIPNPIKNKSANANYGACPMDVNKVCPKCGKIFTAKRSLVRHLKIHTDEKTFACEICEKTFSRNSNRIRHQKSHSKEKSFACEICEKTFKHNSDRIRHQKSHSKEKPFACEICKKNFLLKENVELHMRVHEKHECKSCNAKFTRRSELLGHIRTTHPLAQKRKSREALPSAKKQKRNSRSALNVFSTTVFSPSDENNADLIKFFEEMRPKVEENLKQEMEEKSAIKWYLVSKMLMSRTIKEGVDLILNHFRSKNVIQLVPETLSENINEAMAKISKSFEEFTQRGSGWVLERILTLEVCVARYHPLAPRSYVELPQKLAAKKAVINIQNEDHKCFIWSLLAHLHPVEVHAERVSHYLPFEHEIKMGKVECPVRIDKVNIIENLNGLRVNVYGYEDNEVFPLYISEREDVECINLLYLYDEKTERQHYCLIKNMSRLLGNLTKHKAQAFYCYRCLHRFAQERNLKEHLPYCKKQSAQHIKMPSPQEKMMRFTKVYYQHPIPYIIYADFESILVPIPTAPACITVPEDTTTEIDYSFTNKTNEHKACGYAYVIIGPDGKSVKPIQVYRGEDTVNHFIKSIIEEKNELAKILTTVKPLIMTEEDTNNFETATHCYLCQRKLNNDAVRDHCHISGHYRGAAHNECNLNYQLKKKIPVVFHNLKHYDGHLIMQGLGKLKDHTLDVIASNMEKYITFSISQDFNETKVSLQFIDSLQFTNTSLQKLVSNLKEDEFKILKEHFHSNSQMQLLLKKGIYPYQYMDSFGKFQETSLPSQSAFFSTLTQESVTDEEYAHAHVVWNAFNICNLGEYHDLYVKSDVLQLADVFQNFRRICFQHYGLDCVHLFTAPGLAWQASLKMCEQPLELLTDPTMHLMIEQGVRGGVAMISQRCAQANNKYMKNYDSDKPSSYIMYWDANNLYGWAMSQPLPYDNFKWISPEVISLNQILSHPDNATEGYILEVDLEYPQELHDLHNDYPLAPEKMKVSRSMLSPFTHEIITHSPYTSTEKLIPNLYSKNNYVIHYRNLKLYVELGMKIVKIHKVLQFRQSAWLKPYIEFNTEQRKLASSEFEKDFFKLMNNSVYGKTMENVRKRIDIQLVVEEAKAKRLISEPTFHAFKIFDNEMVGVERIKKKITLNRPLYAGFVILELSKLHMYKFHYGHVKATYGERAQLLFTDTDSLTYHIKTEDVYADMAQYSELFDNSEYPANHPLFNIQNKKKIGCFKDEMSSIPVVEFVGLRAKMYSIKTEEEEKKRAKGVSKTIVKKKLKHNDYMKALLEPLTITRALQYRIQSDLHHLFTVCQNKVALSAMDDKRYILEDGIHTLAHGHCAIIDK